MNAAKPGTAASPQRILMRFFTLAALAFGLSTFSGGLSAEPVKIGFVTTLTTPAGIIGQDMVDAANLALDDMGHTMGGREVELIVADDGFKPGLGKQQTDKLIKKDKVDFVAGYIWSHVLMASLNSVVKADRILVSANAGPAPVAGKKCNANFFSTSWQNDQTPMALGEYLNQAGVKSLYLLAPNYTAGKNITAGVERTFKGEIKGKDLTKWGKDAQLDFSAELAKAKASGAEAMFAFYPGKAGGALFTQYQQAGMADTMPLNTVFTIDALSLPKFQQAGMNSVLGTHSTGFWAPDLDTPQNKQFVSGFKKKYGRMPSFYAAQAYDSIFLIKSGVDAVNGDTRQLDAMRSTMEKADFPSVRGKFTYGNNHMPIQNFYLTEVIVGDDGNWTTKIVDTIYTNHQDPHAKDCPL
jgi:branched-chain amino acid transport system substrate-binding protein